MVTPSSLLGLKRGSYEAYCLDQAVWFFGTQVTHKLEEVGRKKDPKEAANEATRKRLLDNLLGVGKGKNAASQFADPAALFSSR